MSFGRGFNPSVQAILEEMRGPVNEGLPPGSQDGDPQGAGVMAGGNNQAGAKAGGTTGQAMTGVRQNMPPKQAAAKATQANAQLATSVAQQQIDQRAQVSPGMANQQQAAAIAAQPRDPKQTPQQGQDKAQVMQDMVSAADKDKDGQFDANDPNQQQEVGQEQQQQQQPPYQAPAPVRQPGQTRPANEHILDIATAIIEGEDGKLATFLAPHYTQAPSDIGAVTEALTATADALVGKVFSEAVAINVLSQRFDEEAMPIVREFVTITNGVGDILAEAGVTEGLKTKLAKGALATMLAMGAGNMAHGGNTAPDKPDTKPATSLTQGEGTWHKLAVHLAKSEGKQLDIQHSLVTARQLVSKARMAVQSGTMTPQKAVEIIERRYPKMSKKISGMLKNAFDAVATPVVEEDKQPETFTNPDETPDKNENAETGHLAQAEKRRKALADMGGSTQAPPSRMSKDSTDSETADRHREVNDGVLTTEQQDDILDDVFGD